MVYNTRIAPSPTGFFHIGTARTAYFCYLAAKASGGSFTLRIDDTDTEREVEGAVDVILDSMNWLGLDYDFHYYQSDRKPRHLELANILLTKGFAKTLDNGAIALVSPLMPATWHDEIGGDINISNKELDLIDGLILVKGGDKLGDPIYHFASVVDDWDHDINFIIRGTDHISNTSKQLAIWMALNSACPDLQKPVPKFAHVGLIHKDKKKMSKRNAEDPTVFLSYYQENGFNRDAVLDFLLRLGWGPKNENKEHAIIHMDRAIELFLDGGNMRSAPANFDMAKLQNFDRKYKGAIERQNRGQFS